jgi:hypothetical protein
MTKFILEVPSEFIERAEIAYPKDNTISYSYSGLIRDHFDDFVVQMENAVHNRSILAISGAMRWPWSQEAPIDNCGNLE